MSGPNPPDPGSGAAEPDNGQSDGQSDGGTGESGAVEAYSQAYSAPESEHFMSGPYVPVDPELYDFESYADSYGLSDESDAEPGPPRWPWVVGVAVIMAAIALVVSVGLLVGRTETHNIANPVTTTPSLPPVQDEIITTAPPPPPPPPPAETPEPPPPPPPQTVEPPPVAEVPSSEPTTTQPPETTTHPPETTAAPVPAGPRQITYSVTGTKAPFDQITITYIGPSGQRQTLRNAYIPWSLTLTPISRSEVGSVEASSMLRLSRLNCTITSSDGTVLSSNSNDLPQASC